MSSAGWEYLIVSIATGTPTSPGLSVLNRLGGEGWEAVGMDRHNVLVKRRVMATVNTFGPAPSPQGVSQDPDHAGGRE